MALRSVLKAFFRTGAYPTQGQFETLIDSVYVKDEDTVPINKVAGLSDTLAGKASNAAVADKVSMSSVVDQNIAAGLLGIQNGGFVSRYAGKVVTWLGSKLSVAGGGYLDLTDNGSDHIRIQSIKAVKIQSSATTYPDNIDTVVFRGTDGIYRVSDNKYILWQGDAATPADNAANVAAISALQTSKATCKTVATYAAMIADGIPAQSAVIYEVTADENKGFTRSTYLWKTNGNREWLASTPDN